MREREPELDHHVRRVAGLARGVGTRLGLSAGTLDLVERAARMHDVGKIAIPDSILHKPGPLDDTEWALMSTHTLLGERILRAAPALAGVARVVRSTHERWDGAGYPDGLAGAQIPLAARIVFVCDAFHAMTSDRVYRPAMCARRALAELRAGAGRQFDPAVVAAFADHLAAKAGRTDTLALAA
jgi:HD-GYP domain-containing protein (c-di-GMP phosphodiesterase class II)